MIFKESNLQMACKKYFDLHHPNFAPLLFAVPNGGKRNLNTARIMKAEGVVAGVADMILLVSNSQFNALCIEFKTEKGKQTENQRNWQRVAENNGSKYVIIRTFEEFCTTINDYICEITNLQEI